MVQISRVVAVVCVLLAGTARADELGPGEKTVRLAIRVDAAVPAGKALILANTFEGADNVTPGREAPLSWHPLIGGDMQLVLVAASEAERLPALRTGLEREKIKPIIAAGVACGAGFLGVRTLPDTSPAATVRWTFRVDFAGTGCTAKQVGLEYLDADGKGVDPGATVAPPITPPVLRAASEPAKATSEPAKASGGCSVRGADAVGPGVLVFAGVLVRRRRRG